MAFFSSNKLSVKEMAHLCRQLGTAYHAGLPIVSALQIVVDRGASSRARRAMLSMATMIQNGATLADASRAQGEVFPGLFHEVLAAGEAGGHLDALLGDLADHYESMHKITGATLAAMVYPTLQLLCAWYLGTFALGIIGSLGHVAQGERFDFSEYLAGYGYFQLKAHLVALAIAAAFIILNRMGWLGRPASLLKNSLWPINSISRKFALARFFRCMSLLIGAGIEIKRAIRQSAAMTLNDSMEQDLLRSIPVVMKGGSLVEAFAPCRCLSRVDREMIAVGEKSGELDAMMRKAAQYHFEEARNAVHAAIKVLQVLITLVVGVVIGYVVISFYSGLYGPTLDLM